jgi:hypothetical protein
MVVLFPALTRNDIQGIPSDLCATPQVRRVPVPALYRCLSRVESRTMS